MIFIKRFLKIVQVFINRMNSLNSKKKLLVLFIIISLPAALIYACGSSTNQGVATNLLQISLSCPGQNSARELSKESGILRSLEDIVLLRLTVEGGNPPLDPITEEFSSDVSILPIEVPAGTGRLFTIEGLDSESNVICFGQTVTDINIDTTDIDIGCEFVVEICDDLADNDFDELIDCGDPDCEDICDGGGGMGDAGDDDDDGTPAREDDFAGECGDEIDNDEDGFTDCDDNDCIRSIDCIPPEPVPPPAGGTCTFFTGEGEPFPDCFDRDCCGESECVETDFCLGQETNCFDQFDNDQDGDTDCDDIDCCNQCEVCFEPPVPIPVIQNPAFCSNPE